MIKYLHSGEIDRSKWDHCIRTSKQNLIYGFSWYLDLVSPRWEGLVLNDYKAIMPLTVKTRFGIKYMYQPLYAQQLGIYSRIYPDNQLTIDFLKTIPEEIRYVDYNLNSYHSMKGLKIKYSTRSNYELKLNTPYEVLESNFSSNTRRNIRKSLLNSELVNDVSPSELVRLKRQTQVIKMKNEFYEWLNIYLHKLIQGGKGRIIGVMAGEKLVAASFIVLSANKLYYLVSASNEQGKKTSAMFAIVDYIIGKYADTGLILDFEGSSIKGVARFFAGFGAGKKEYYNIRLNRLPFPLCIFKK
ncbi:MAG: GNAT family N-acetyltransferase [Bacteroidota bacterium]